MRVLYRVHTLSDIPNLLKEKHGLSQSYIIIPTRIVKIFDHAYYTTLIVINVFGFRTYFIYNASTFDLVIGEFNGLLQVSIAYTITYYMAIIIP